VPYLKLLDLASQHANEIRASVARLGRSPDCTVVVTGEAAGVVSAVHAELRHADGEWRLADLGSRNGTFVNGRRLAAPVTLKPGDVIGLGERGPRFSVAQVGEGLPPTIPEHPGLVEPAARRPLEARAYGITLLDAATGRLYEARGSRIRIGRGRECEIQPGDASDTVVSRVHAELRVGPTGALVARDAGSTNGTFINDERITEPVPVRLGDRIMLGRGGPVLIVEGLGTAPQLPVARPVGVHGPRSVGTVLGRAWAAAREERGQGKRRSTAFLKAVAAEVGQDSRRRLRWVLGVVFALLVALGGAVYGVYWLLSTQVEQTAAEERSAADSARAETERLRRELDAARAAAAPAAQVDSLRTQLQAAEARTAELRAALDRAQRAIAAQLAEGETRRVAAQNELQRLRDELATAERQAASRAAVDSLERAVTAAEHQTQNLDAKMRAVRGTDFATIAQQNQAAVGLITASFGRDYYNGTGFVISADGYMLTNWHVVADSLHGRADTLWVIMADQSQARYADVIALSQERDIAVIKVRGYQGPFISSIDWNGTKARQGEPAALIGYPAGSGFARLRSAVIRTSMTAGIISRATEDVIQFDGITIGGSSGSPLFDAAGEVVAMHRAGLVQAQGFALLVPIKHAVAIMPVALRLKLGITASE
jgi:pSer/pThr/pTyr-binding forkhead associated (FHA) protein/S1-C subfamily serine protease